MKRPSKLLGLLLAGAFLAAASPASADPQISAALTLGPAFRGLRTPPVRPAFHLGGRADILFLRASHRGMGLGPYVELGTSGFDAFEAGGGVEWLVPAWSTAFIFSGGTGVRASGSGSQPVATWGLFWGSRSYNFHSLYGFGAGLFAQGRYGLGDSRSFDVITGAQIDLALLALPFVFAVQALRH